MSTLARLEAIGARARADLAAARRTYEGRRDWIRAEPGRTAAVDRAETEVLPRLMAPVSFGAARLRTGPRSRPDAAIG
ncbi:hypothetical protein C6V83_06455 [Gordonia iterans]|uniref:Uncharacterized protein n=1 Tax=Gordonia iterans TaxID=1004901 RepID=A0A2S0KE86_9ACTN|nr:hypothetical protein [Gordonia iterans]AVL99965.1 hypothetical protein C6V83_06455 [Gordonia iterans]